MIHFIIAHFTVIVLTYFSFNLFLAGRLYEQNDSEPTVMQLWITFIWLLFGMFIMAVFVLFNEEDGWAHSLWKFICKHTFIHGWFNLYFRDVYRKGSGFDFNGLQESVKQIEGDPKLKAIPRNKRFLKLAQKIVDKYNSSPEPISK